MSNRGSASCVYLVCGGDVYKVGKASDAAKRLADMQIGSPVRLSLVHVIPTDSATAVELYFHRLFKETHSHGEWFRLTPDQIATFRSFSEADAEKAASEYTPKTLAPGCRGLAEGVKRLREERGWTQTYLAERVGISRQYLNLIEQQRSGPYFDTVQALAAALDVSTEVFRDPS